MQLVFAHLPRGLAVAALGLALLQVLGRCAYPKRADGDVLMGNMPRWRCLTVLPLAFVMLPLLYAAALAQHGFSLERWSAALGRDAPHDAYTLALVCLLSLYWALDFVQWRARFILRVHHVVCIVTMALGVIYARAGFPYMLGGICVLELGSGSASVIALWPPLGVYEHIGPGGQRYGPTWQGWAWVHVTVMAATGVGALAAGVLCVARLTDSRVDRVVGVWGLSATVGLIFFRQEEAVRLARKARPASEANETGRPLPPPRRRQTPKTE